MMFNFRRDFCLWVVPSNDGRVRKVRFSFARACAVGLVCFGIAFGFLFIAGDYARVQVLHLKNRAFLSEVTRERDTLLSENSELDGRVANLKESNSRVLSYEENVRLRLDELQSILHSASSLGVIPSEGIEKKSEDLLDDVGGAEIDCHGSDCFGASGKEAVSLQVFDGHLLPLREGLLERLDNVIDRLRYVPVGSPANGHITSHYGPRRSPFSGKRRMHQGVDFSVPHGSQIFSTADGTVKSVKKTSTYGLVIDVAHTSGVVTRYAHLSRSLVKKGEKICRGEALGLVGSTGHSTGPHLHYEIRVNGKAVDPLQLMELAPQLEGVF